PRDQSVSELSSFSRFNYSIRNHWIDKEKRIYFIFTNQER
ncbi:replication initiator protein A, partial [Limosilactobacillus fermentum]